MILKSIGFIAFRIVLVAFAGFTILTSASAEEIYKTIGKDGIVFYSSEPPSSTVKAEVIEVFPAPSAEATIAAQEELEKVLTQYIDQDLETKNKAKVQALQSTEAAKPKPVALPSNPFIGLAPFL